MLCIFGQKSMTFSIPVRYRNTFEVLVAIVLLLCLCVCVVCICIKKLAVSVRHWQIFFLIHFFATELWFCVPDYVHIG